MAELISVREAARRIGVSDTAVLKAIKAGRVLVHSRNPTNGRPMLAWPAVQHQWNANTDSAKRTHVGATGTSARREKYAPTPPEVVLPVVGEEAPEPTPAPYMPTQAAATMPAAEDQMPAAGKGPSYAQSRAVRELYAAKLLKLEHEERIGKLVPADQVKVDAFKTARTVRDGLLNIPDRVAHILAAETDPARVHHLLSNELRTVLSQLSSHE